MKNREKQVQETKPKNKRQETHKEHRARIKNNVESKKTSSGRMNNRKKQSTRTIRMKTNQKHRTISTMKTSWNTKNKYT